MSAEGLPGLLPSEQRVQAAGALLLPPPLPRGTRALPSPCLQGRHPGMGPSLETPALAPALHLSPSGLVLSLTPAQGLTFP